MQRDFKGVWIPKEIWLTEDLGWTEKFLLTEIDSLSQNHECFATNEYFAKFFNISKDRVSKIISNLANKGYVEVKLIYKPGTKQVEKRVITTRGYRRKQLEGIGENNYTPIGENAEDINTSFINPIINDDVVDETHPEILLKNKYMQLAAIRGFDISAKDKSSIQQVIDGGVPIQDALVYLEETFLEYEPKHARDKINSFAYCASCILGKHADKKETANGKKIPQYRGGHGRPTSQSTKEPFNVFGNKVGRY